MMSPAAAEGKRKTAVQVALYLAVCVAGGMAYQAGKWAWDWMIAL
ncbi:hypothetical protein ACPCSP_25370 [Streptomyces cinereoruber]